MPETMKLLGSNRSKINKDKIGENVLQLEITEIVLMLCNFVNSDYQQYVWVFTTSVPNKSSDQLLNISPKNVIFF